ncbi:LysR family transcriptional regulator [Algiphilus sp.]|uniref:LysR family transcriptional regulator n=1 Tax=Algiphilus sp. TaxID=1872431 RepID=UPI003C31206F
MQLSAIEAFVAVCEHGSVRAAAAAMHLTQPAISKRIATLEAQFGHELFDRVGRGIAPTEAGRAFLPHARRLLAELEDGRRALDSLSAHVSGRLGLALSHHVALHRMPPMLRRFVNRYPDVALDIAFLGSEAACESVARGHIELAVITLPRMPPEPLVQREIWPDPMRICVACDHPLAREAEPTAARLGDYPALLPEAGTATHALVAEALAARGVPLQTQVASNYLETLKMLTAVGLGWSALPATMIDDELIALEFPGLRIQRSLGAVHHPGRRLSNAARALLDALDGA